MKSKDSFEKDFKEKRIAFHQYTVMFKYLPESFKLLGSNNKACWFILDEVYCNEPKKDKEMFVVNKSIDNNTFFQVFKISTDKKNIPENQKIELIFNEVEYEPYSKLTMNDLCKEADSKFIIEFEPTPDMNFCKKIGLIESLISNSLHALITTHKSDSESEFIQNIKQDYSIFSNVRLNNQDLITLDPRPKSTYEFIFHSFIIKPQYIFFKTSKQILFSIEYLNSEGSWNFLIQNADTKQIHAIGDIQMHGIRFDTRILGLKDFDFFGTIEFIESKTIEPCTYVGFPFWGKNKSGIIDGIRNHTNLEPTESGLFRVVGQYDTARKSKKAYLESIETVFDESNGPPTITFYFNFQVRLSHYLINVPECQNQSDQSQIPLKWKLEGSNNNLNWTLLSEIEDHIFELDIQAVVYQSFNTSDYFSIFRLVKLNDIRPFNKLVLSSIEFFGLISPFYSSPSNFWNSDHTNEIMNQSFFSNDLCNGILGSLNYYGNARDQTLAEYKFDSFFINLKSLALINPPSDLKIFYTNKEGEFELTKPASVYKICGNVLFYHFDNFISDISKLRFSEKTNGLELFGTVYKNKSFKLEINNPTNFVERNFDLNINGNFDILSYLLISEFKHNFSSGLQPTFFTIKPLNSNTFIKTSDNQKIRLDSDETDFIIDFIDSSVSLELIIIETCHFKSLTIQGSNEDNYENMENFDNSPFVKIFTVEFSKVLENIDSRIFVIKAENKNSFRYFKLIKNQNCIISSINFFGRIEITRKKSRPPCQLKLFDKTYIQSGLDCQNGILNALEKIKFPFLKENKGNTYSINFIEIDIFIEFIILFDPSVPIKRITGYNKDKEIQFFYKTIKDKSDKNKIDINSKDPVTILEIETDSSDFNYEKFELYGAIDALKPDPICKTPPDFKFLLNPFNGILKSESYKFKLEKHHYYISIEFLENIQILLSNVLVEFESSLNSPFNIEATNDLQNWTKLKIKEEKYSDRQFKFDITESKKFYLFHFYTTEDISINQIELFGKGFEVNRNEKPLNQVSFLNQGNIIYDSEKQMNGIFYYIYQYFSSLSIVLSTKGSSGNKENNEISLFDPTLNEIVIFESDNNIISINFKFLKIKLTGYLLYFGPQLFENKKECNWTLKGSNDMKNWEHIHSGSDYQSHEIKIYSSATSSPYSHFEFIIENPAILRKIEFFGECIPFNETYNSPIIKNQPVPLRNNQFYGILSSMCRFTNPFKNNIINTVPESLSKIFYSNESVEFNGEFKFEFDSFFLSLNYYSIDTSMKSWKVEVSSDKDKWIEIHATTDFIGCNTFVISNPLRFNKIRFVNNNGNKSELKKIEFFGSIFDDTFSYSYRYDIMNGILSNLILDGSPVFSKEVSIKSSDYRFTQPIQIFDRKHLNRVFGFVKDSSTNLAFVTLEFWKKAIKVDNYSLIIFQNSHLEQQNTKYLKIEGATEYNKNSNYYWEEIDTLNQSKLNDSYIFSTSKSEKFFHFIRISSNEEFFFENIEFFGDVKEHSVELPKNEHIFESSSPETNLQYNDSSIIEKFIPKKDEKLKGFFHSDNISFYEPFIKLEPPDLFSNESISLQSKIEIHFLTTSFQLTHALFEIEGKSAKYEFYAGGQIISQGNLSRKSNLISFPLLKAFNSFSFNFETEQPVTLKYFEIFGNLIEYQYEKPERLLSYDHNFIDLSFFRNDRNSLFEGENRYDIFNDGILHFIVQNSGGSFLDNKIVSVYETYPDSECLVNLKSNSPVLFNFGNSPRLTFSFNCLVQIERYALDSKMRRWIVEGSPDQGKTWFLIDVQFGNDTESNKNIQLFSLRKKTRYISCIRLTNMDALFDGENPSELAESCGVNRIEFYGDLKVSFYREKAKSENNIDFDFIEEHETHPKKNLIFFPDEASPRKDVERKKEVEREKKVDEYDYEFEDEKPVNKTHVNKLVPIENLNEFHTNHELQFLPMFRMGFCVIDSDSDYDDDGDDDDDDDDEIC